MVVLNLWQATTLHALWHFPNHGLDRRGRLPFHRDVMSRQVIVERIRCVPDARGLLFEPVDETTLQTQANVHVVLTQPGCVRGNHRHLRGTEIAVVTGEALVRVKQGGSGETRDYLVRPGEAWRFTIPPGIPHAFKNTGNAPMLLIGFNTVAHDPANPDTAPENVIAT